MRLARQCLSSPPRCSFPSRGVSILKDILWQALPCLILAALCQGYLSAQMIDDPVMVPAHTLFGGYTYTHDSWNQYWEGQLLRANGNIGTLTTETSSIYVNYGLTSKINIIANIPYVRTDASEGVLEGQSGWQDIKIAVKFRAPTLHIGHLGSLSSFVVPFWTTPLTDYIADFQPLSLGLHTVRDGMRSTVNFQLTSGWCVNATGAYTWQKDVALDRPYYFTNGQFFTTNVVKMPDVVDYGISPGYAKKDKMAQFTFSKLITQGGPDVGDIRRQDAPFIANRFISTRIGGSVMYPLPWVRNFDLWLEYSHVIDGRNVGQSNTFTIGLFRTQSSFRKQRKIK